MAAVSRAQGDMGKAAVRRMGLVCLVPVLLLAACAPVRPTAGAQAPEPPRSTAAPADGVRYRCEDGQAFTARARSDGVLIEGLAGGPQALLRDAGGLTPQHTVFSGPRLRAEFGVGTAARGALLHQLQPVPSTVRCESA